MNKALILFGRTPVPGKVKSRLAREIGAMKAFDVYCSLLSRSLETGRHVDARLFFFLTELPDDASRYQPYITILQEDGDLGDRMEGAFRRVFEMGFEKAVLVGTDCYEMKTSDIELAFTGLGIMDLVIGPARDGGYYLIGMNSPHPKLFKEISWGHGQVLRQTIIRARKAKLGFLTLRLLEDIDTADDLARSPLAHFIR